MKQWEELRNEDLYSLYSSHKVRLLARLNEKGQGSRACTKMIGAVSSGRNGFGNARRSMFPTWNETAGIQVLVACAIPLPSPLSLSVSDVTQRKWRFRSRKRFMCCTLRSMNQLFLFSGPSGTISE
jgi:hypothetical protein